MGCQDSRPPGFSPPCCPHCCWSIHIWTSLTPTAHLDHCHCLILWSTVSARHLTTPALCLPDSHHFVTAVVPITCSMWWSVQCLVLAFPHLASVPGSCVQNLMCCDGNAACSTENMGSLCVPSCLSHNLLPFTTHWSLLISRSFIYVSHLLN